MACCLFVSRIFFTDFRWSQGAFGSTVTGPRNTRQGITPLNQATRREVTNEDREHVCKCLSKNSELASENPRPSIGLPTAVECLIILHSVWVAQAEKHCWFLDWSRRPCELRNKKLDSRIFTKFQSARQNVKNRLQIYKMRRNEAMTSVFFRNFRRFVDS